MKTLFKDTSAVILAAVAVLGFLFLPPGLQGRLDEFLDFLASTEGSAQAFSSYLIQKAVSGTAILIITVFLTVAAHKAYKHTAGRILNREENEEDY